MPYSAVRSFTDPDEYAAAIYASSVDLTVIERGNFRASQTRIDPHRLWVRRASESLPRTADVEQVAGRAYISFPATAGSSIVYGGIRVHPGEMVRHNPGRAYYQMTSGTAHWAAMSLPVDDMAGLGAAMAGYDLAPPRDALTLHPSQSAMAKLLGLLATAGRLAERAPEIIANPNSARGLEQAFIQALVTCLNKEDNWEDTAAQRRHEAIMRRFRVCSGPGGVQLGSIGGLKYMLNIKSAGLGETMILSLRKDIFSSTLPLKSGEAINETAKDKAGTFVAMIASEAEAVGKFVGDCISTPTVQAGTLLSVLGYMLYTEPLLGLVVLLIAVPQVFAVPLIQRRINTLVRERVRTVRRAGDLIVDNMQGSGGSSASSLASEIGKAFEAICGVRLLVFKLKFGLKFLVSGLQSVGVFALLFVGGIMVLKGKTEIGIVVAFISGLDRVIDPWRELIAFVRSTSAAKVQFDLIEGTLARKL